EPRPGKRQRARGARPLLRSLGGRGLGPPLRRLRPRPLDRAPDRRRLGWPHLVRDPAGPRHHLRRRATPRVLIAPRACPQPEHATAPALRGREPALRPARLPRARLARSLAPRPRPPA